MAYISEIDGATLAATKLVNARDFSVAGDATTASAVSFDGTGNVTLTVTLANTADARTHLGLGSAAVQTAATTGNSVVVMTNAEGKLDDSIVPKTIITDVFVSPVLWKSTYEAAYQAGVDWANAKLAEETTNVGDVAVINIAWGGTEAAPAGSATGSFICYMDESSGTPVKAWAELKTPDETRIAALETAVTNINTAIGDDSTAGTIKGRIKAIETDLDPTTAGGTGKKLADVISAVGDTTTAGTIEYKLANHIGLGGSDATGAATHPTATTTATGFMPKLSTNATAATEYLGGDGSWHTLASFDSNVIIATTGATAGAITKVGNHYGVAKSATEVVAAGVVTFGTGHTVGQNVWVKTSDNSVSYGDIPSTAGTYQMIGITTSATQIDVAPLQQTYTIVA